MLFARLNHQSLILPSNQSSIPPPSNLASKSPTIPQSIRNRLPHSFIHDSFSSVSFFSFSFSGELIASLPSRAFLLVKEYATSVYYILITIFKGCFPIPRIRTVHNPLFVPCLISPHLISSHLPLPKPPSCLPHHRARISNLITPAMENKRN